MGAVLDSDSSSNINGLKKGPGQKCCLSISSMLPDPLSPSNTLCLSVNYITYSSIMYSVLLFMNTEIRDRTSIAACLKKQWELTYFISYNMCSQILPADLFMHLYG